MISDNFLGFLTPSLPLSELVIFPLYWRRHIWAHPPSPPKMCFTCVSIYCIAGSQSPFYMMLLAESNSRIKFESRNEIA